MPNSVQNKEEEIGILLVVRHEKGAYFFCLGCKKRSYSYWRSSIEDGIYTLYPVYKGQLGPFSQKCHMSACRNFLTEFSMSSSLFNTGSDAYNLLIKEGILQ